MFFMRGLYELLIKIIVPLALAAVFVVFPIICFGGEFLYIVKHPLESITAASVGVILVLIFMSIKPY